MNKKNRRLYSLVLVLMLLLAFSLNAMAAENKDSERKKKIIQQETGISDNIIVPLAGNYTLSGYDSATHNGATMYTSFEAYLSDYFTGSVMRGQSRAVWLGSNPYNCTSLSLDTQVKLTGLAITVGANSSGFTVSGGVTSKTLTMSDSIANDWRLYQNYSNVTFDGVDLFYRHTSAAKFVFGVQSYYVNATDSVWP